jgi:ADP-L-glycero-D-manno-heptose 6-epimerase
MLKMCFDQICMILLLCFIILHNAGCVKFIYASSTAVYGNQPAPYTEFTRTEPLTPYAESKLAFDEFAMDFADKHKVSVIGFRYCNIYGRGEEHKGSRMSMISQIYQAAFLNKEIQLFKNGEQKRDWVHIFDIVKVNLLALDNFKTGIYNIGSGTSSSFLEVLDIIKNALGTRYPSALG